MEAAVEARGVRKAYDDVAAVDGVSLAVRPGEVFALIGPNGAGKTTLVRCLTGTTTPDGGDVTLLGDDPGVTRRERVGLLPQSFDPAGRLTARELVAYYAGLYDDARDPEVVLEEVGPVPGDTRYENLSGGQRRRVCVATALVNDPDVLFLDEPTTGIDPAGRRALWSVIEDLAAGGTTVFLTTHDMAEAGALADRVGLLADGRLAAVGTPGHLVAEHGGASRLTVETDADADAVADGPLRVTDDDAGLVFEGVDPAEIGDVVRLLDDRGVSFGALAWSEPDLESVYFELTGTRIGRGERARDGTPSERGETDGADGTAAEVTGE